MPACCICSVKVLLQVAFVVARSFCMTRYTLQYHANTQPSIVHGLLLIQLTPKGVVFPFLFYDAAIMAGLQ